MSIEEVYLFYAHLFTLTHTPFLADMLIDDIFCPCVLFFPLKTMSHFFFLCNTVLYSRIHSARFRPFNCNLHFYSLWSFSGYTYAMIKTNVEMNRK